MPVEASSVRVGHCYAGSDGRQFRVTALVDGRVHFETLGANEAGSSEVEAPMLEEFQRRLEKEVSCPEGDRSVPSQAEGERGQESTGMSRPVPSQAEGERGRGDAQ